jgi:hypothetical protein
MYHIFNRPNSEWPPKSWGIKIQGLKISFNINSIYIHVHVLYIGIYISKEINNIQLILYYST